MKSYAQRMKKTQIANLQQSPAVGAQIGNQAMGALMGYDESKSKSDPALEDKMRAKLQKRFSFPNQEAHREPGGMPLPPTIQKEYEKKSGVPLDDVRVHYNSEKPDRTNADAYAYGSNIFMRSAANILLEHEIGHVIQQKLGMVSPMQTIGTTPISTSDRLERTANSLGNLQIEGTPKAVLQKGVTLSNDPLSNEDLEMIKAIDDSIAITPRVRSIMKKLDHTVDYDNEPADEVFTRIKKVKDIIDADTNLKSVTVDQSSSGLKTPKKSITKTELRADDMPFRCKIKFAEITTEKENIFAQIASNAAEMAVKESLMGLSTSEKRLLREQNIKMTIFVVGKSNQQQQSIWKKSKGQHDVTIYLHGGHAFTPFSVAGGLTTKTRSKLDLKQNSLSSMCGALNDTEIHRYCYAVTTHELGHVFHALLHPLEFNLLNSATSTGIQQTFTVGDITFSEAKTMFKNSVGNQASFYAFNSQSPLEFIAEIFTTLRLGGQIDHRLYDWYIANGGPSVTN